jgi:hypothetical protein
METAGNTVSAIDHQVGGEFGGAVHSWPPDIIRTVEVNRGSTREAPGVIGMRSCVQHVAAVAARSSWLG